MWISNHRKKAMKTTKVPECKRPTASQEYMWRLAKALLLFSMVLFLISGCTDSLEDALPGSESDPSYYHPTGWKDDPQHGSDFCDNQPNCEACHGQDLEGGSSGVSCVVCHAENLHHGGTVYLRCYECHHESDIADCEGCHPDCKPGSHPTHTTVNNKGPATALDCDGCHDTNHYPLFGEADAAESLADTSVCDDCHSPNGAYDGVDDTNIGAKNNWASGVYSGDGSTLDPGKEKWCVGCHDNDPAIIDGIDAPKVGGDGVNYGYFINGHGNTSNNTELACTDCHDVGEAAFLHIDAEQRTYAFNPADYNDGTSYQAGYRLKSIDGQPPMKIPANTRTDDDYRLCFDSGCHVWDDVLGDTPVVTNFSVFGPDPPLSYSYGPPPPEANQHHLHVVSFVDAGHWSAGRPWWDSDWDLSTLSAAGYFDSTITCVSCHNVHGAEGYAGSTNEAMVRDGKLVSGRPDPREGFKFSYVQDRGLPMVTSSGATRTNSIGAVFRSGEIEYNTEHNMCMGCHGSGATCMNMTCHHFGTNYDVLGDEDYDATGNYVEYYRTPN